MKKISRIILIVMDSVGIGNASDAEQYGDSGANTLENIAKWAQKNQIPYQLPTLTRLGLGRLLNVYKNDFPYIGASARLEEISAGKDTTTGHWEIAGTPLQEPFSFFPEGFPKDLVKKWCEQANLPGVLGNKMYSGTAAIDLFGDEHINSGKPILYTSMDSVFQVAAHEKHFGLERLYKICELARELTRDIRIGRIIARPFVGENKENFKRVAEHRRDFSLEPPLPNLIDLVARHLPVASVGKIDDIFCHRSIKFKNHTGNNKKTGEALVEFLKNPDLQKSFIFANFIDFDQDHGHRRDPKGYIQCLKEFDAYIDKILPQLSDEDLLLITADHGNDPTFRGTDHTRENVPLLCYSHNPAFQAVSLGQAKGYFHITKLILESFGFREEISELPSLNKTQSLASQIWRDS
jgi:phosphopentomutase